MSSKFNPLSVGVGVTAPSIMMSASYFLQRGVLSICEFLCTQPIQAVLHM